MTNAERDGGDESRFQPIIGGGGAWTPTPRKSCSGICTAIHIDSDHGAAHRVCHANRI